MGGITRGLGALGVAVALLLGAGCSGDSSPDRAEPSSPVPLPSHTEAETGPERVRVSTVQAREVAGRFGGGTVYRPERMSPRPAVIAASPGLGADRSTVTWYGHLLASHGFVLIAIDTLTLEDSPDRRAEQLLNALDYLTRDGPLAGRVNADRQAVLGHSMGGGAALVAASRRPSIRAVVSLTPWYESPRGWPGVRAPTLVVAGSTDQIAPPSEYAKPFYQGLDNARERAYLSLDGDHLVGNYPRKYLGSQVLAWFGRFLDGDVRYDRRLCPPPPERGAVVEYRDSCPHPRSG
ncbi:alpha/beta hydrolase [Streptomyces sp. NPDC005438]|uniref:alpha/beta hydrolase family protein n=1 Tax=Streptomyces sp. NPDC005438 TaxID=3156880 RepID=UPI00339F34EF